MYPFRDNIPEAQRRLAYDLQRFWDANDVVMRRLIRAYRVAAAGLVVEIATLGAVVSGTILT